MEFEWDENKRQSNLAKHGVDFLDAALMFAGPVFTKIDDRQNYGEVREISLGKVDGDVYCVTHTTRGHRVRLISAWKGGAKDHERYQNSIS
ncbi:MAG: BrnT family toxin [Aestuariivita sp.]|nr:BrnT family toxin [Aestuariivita sp.]